MKPPYEHKRSSFLVEVEQIPSYLIYSIDRPTFTYIGNTYEPLPIDMWLYDPISPSSTRLIFDEFINKSNNLIGNVTINILGLVGEYVEKWELTDVKILEICFDKMTMEGVKPLGIKLKLSYKAELIF